MGEGVTLKLLCESGFNLLLHEVANKTTVKANKSDKRLDFLFMLV